MQSRHICLHPPPAEVQLPTRPARTAKTVALQAIRHTGTRPKTAAIPQLEGAEATPETSPDTSIYQTADLSSLQDLSPREPWTPTPSLIEQLDNLEDADFYDPQQDNFLFFDEIQTSDLLSQGSDNLSLEWDIETSIQDIQNPTLQLQLRPPSRTRRHTFSHFCHSTTCRCTKIYPNPMSW